MRGRSTPAPDDLPRSRSGRVPQWVIDEAAGRTVEAPAWRAGSSGYLDREPPRRRRWAARALTVAVVVGLLGVAYVAHPPVFGPAVADDPTAPPPGLEEAAAPLGTPAAVPAGGEGKFRFTSTTNGTDPVTFSPCRPIHYVVRSDNAPPRGATMIAAAVKQVSRATGLAFIDDGPTDEAPSQERAVYQPDRYGARWAPVLIAWATPSEVPDFGVDIACEAGPVRVTSGDGEHTAYVSGMVALDPAKIDRIRASLGEPLARAIIMHELGHLVGLAHTEHDDQLMFPRGNAGVTKYAVGDRTGLARLGQGPCQPNL